MYQRVVSKAILAFCVLLLCTTHAIAQTDSIYRLASVDITANRLSRYATGQYITTVDSVALAHFSLRSLSDAIQQHTSLDLRSYGGSLSTLSIRGGGASQVAFIWNGINLQNSLSGIFDLSMPSLGGISSISLKTGGESAVFGGGALSGVVFMDNQIADKNGFHGDVTALLGSFGDVRQQARLSLGNGRWATQCVATHQRADNDFPFRNISAIGQPVQRQVNAQQRQSTVLHSLFGHITDKTILQTHFWWTHATRSIAPTMIAANNNAIQDEQNLRGLMTITHQHRHGLLQGRMAITDDFLRYNSNLVSDSRNIGQNRIAEIEQEGAVSPKWQYRIGTNFTQNIARSNNFEQRQQRDRWSVFLSQKFDLKHFTLGANLRQEWIGNAPVPLTGSLGLSGTAWQKHLHRLIWRTSAARNYNLPALNDLYWANLGNPDLRPESGWSAEVGMDYELGSPSAHSKGQIAAHLTGYAMRVRDRIQWLPGSDGLWRPSNIATTHHRGVEIALSATRQFGHWHFIGRGGYQFTHAVNSDGFQLLYVPLHTAQASITTTYRHWHLQWRQLFNGPRPMVSDESINTEAFALSHLEAGRTLHFARGRHLSLLLTAQNLFNTDYQVIQYYAMPRRQWLAQVNFRF